jgi:hypothetical protein
MRLPSCVVLCSAPLSVLLVARIGLAHSWCQTGPAAPSGPPDLVSYVCSQPGFEDCCTSRWSLACVQEAAAYHEANNPGADYCGRYAWTHRGHGSILPKGFQSARLGTMGLWRSQSANGMGLRIARRTGTRGRTRRCQPRLLSYQLWRSR